MAIAGIIPIGMAIAAMIPHWYIDRRDNYIDRRGEDPTGRKARIAPTGIVGNDRNWVAIK